MKIISRLLVLLILQTTTPELRAQVIDAAICDSSSRLPITQYTEYIRTTTLLEFDPAQWAAQSFTRAANKPVLVFNYDPYYYYFRIVISNRQPQARNLMLLMAPFGLYDGRLYQKEGGKWKQVGHTGLKYSFKERSYQFTHHVFPFTLEANTIDTLYVSIDASNAYKSIGFALLRPKDLKIFENNIYFVFGIIVGLLLLFFTLNIAVFFAFGNKLQLWYSFYISLLFLIVMKNDLLDQQFLGMDSERAFRVTPYLTIGACAIAILTYVVQQFLKPVLENNKFLYGSTSILRINLLVSAVVHAGVFLYAKDYRIELIVFNWGKISVLLGIVSIFANCVYCTAKNFRNALFILAGSFVFLLGSLQRLFFPSTLSFLFPPTTFHIGIIVETFIISIGLVYQDWSKKRADRRAQYEEVKQYQEQLSMSKLETQEQTLQQISRELHDNFGHVVSLIKINLNTLQLNDSDKALSKIEDSKLLTRQLMADIKSLSLTLNSDRIIKDGFVKVLQTDVERLGKTGLFNVKFTEQGQFPTVDNNKLTILYRMAQEVLNNMAKHSEASLISVDVNTKNNLLTLEIHDNGKGFDLDEKMKNGGSGLSNLQKRAALINASLDIQSRPGLGSSFIIQVPVENHNSNLQY